MWFYSSKTVSVTFLLHCHVLLLTRVDGGNESQSTSTTTVPSSSRQNIDHHSSHIAPVSSSEVSDSYRNLILSPISLRGQRVLSPLPDNELQHNTPSSSGLQQRSPQHSTTKKKKRNSPLPQKPIINFSASMGARQNAMSDLTTISSSTSNVQKKNDERHRKKLAKKSSTSVSASSHTSSTPNLASGSILSRNSPKRKTTTSPKTIKLNSSDVPASSLKLYENFKSYISEANDNLARIYNEAGLTPPRRLETSPPNALSLTLNPDAVHEVGNQSGISGSVLPRREESKPITSQIPLTPSAPLQRHSKKKKESGAARNLYLEPESGESIGTTRGRQHPLVPSELSTGLQLPFVNQSSVDVLSPFGQQQGVPILQGGVQILQGTVPILQGAVPLHHRGLPILQGGLPVFQEGLPVLQGGLPVLQGGLPVLQGGLPVLQGGLPVLQGGLPVLQGGFPANQGGFPAHQGGLPPHQGGSIHDNVTLQPQVNMHYSLNSNRRTAEQGRPSSTVSGIRENATILPSLLGQSDEQRNTYASTRHRYCVDCPLQAVNDSQRQIESRQRTQPNPVPIGNYNPFPSHTIHYQRESQTIELPRSYQAVISQQNVTRPGSNASSPRKRRTSHNRSRLDLSTDRLLSPSLRVNHYRETERGRRQQIPQVERQTLQPVGRRSSRVTLHPRRRSTHESTRGIHRSYMQEEPFQGFGQYIQPAGSELQLNPPELGLDSQSGRSQRNHNRVVRFPDDSLRPITTRAHRGQLNQYRTDWQQNHGTDETRTVRRSNHGFSDNNSEMRDNTEHLQYSRLRSQSRRSLDSQNQSSVHNLLTTILSHVVRNRQDEPLAEPGSGISPYLRHSRNSRLDEHQDNLYASDTSTDPWYFQSEERRRTQSRARRDRLPENQVLASDPPPYPIIGYSQTEHIRLVPPTQSRIPRSNRVYDLSSPTYSIPNHEIGANNGLSHDSRFQPRTFSGLRDSYLNGGISSSSVRPLENGEPLLRGHVPQHANITQFMHSLNLPSISIRDRPVSPTADSDDSFSV